MSECARPDCREPKAPGHIWCRRHLKVAVVHATKQAINRRSWREKKPRPCQAIRMNDEMMCGLCHVLWSVDDPDPPICPQSKKAE